MSQRVTLSHPSNLLGHVLDGKYRIEAKLGSGGMGDVYRATRLLIGDSVAIKILHPHLAIDPQAAERFRREAVTATQLRHRNVVALFDVGISAAHNVPYILMELAEGFSLRQLINQYRVLPLDFVVTVAAQVCAALDEAHRLGIVHRDIKPENIIANQTTTGWQIKILDFGIAKLYNQADIGLTQDGSAMGTPQYMSPEQCMGEQLDGRSDIYSVGIVLYEMLCGTVPFKSATASAIAVFQVQSSPPTLRSIDPNIHPDVEAVILRSLEKDPDARQRTALQLSQEMIRAATTAFKSGMADVSAVPIAAPDVVPEFDGEGVVPTGDSRSAQLQRDEVSVDSDDAESKVLFEDEVDHRLSTTSASDEADPILEETSDTDLGCFDRSDGPIAVPIVSLTTADTLTETVQVNSGAVENESLARSSESIAGFVDIAGEATFSGAERTSWYRSGLWFISLVVAGFVVVGIAVVALMGGFVGFADHNGNDFPASLPEATNLPADKGNQSTVVSDSSPTPASTQGSELPTRPPSKTESKQSGKKIPPPRSTPKPSNSGSKDWRCVYTNSC